MSDNAYRNIPELKLDQRFLAATVGAVAVLLPVVLGAGSLLNPPLRQSISHFYYVPFFGDVLVGALIFIGTFLIAYRGLLPHERSISNFAGLAAYGIALFPTSGSGIAGGTVFARVLSPVSVTLSGSPAQEVTTVTDAGFPAHFQLFRYVDILHFGSAALLFGFLAYCALFVFTRPSSRNPDDAANRPKKMRNGIYYVCGGIILLAMAALAAKALLGLDAEWNRLRLTFVCETAALWAFGVSWLVKGRFFMKATFLMDNAERSEQGLS
jgi:membrane protease YdiL (CAAX protease family)